MSNNFAIVVDSTCDLPHELAEKWELTVIPMVFNLDGKEYLNYLDYRQLSVKDFYDTLRAGKTASTAQVTVFNYMEAWKPHLEAGKDVLHFCLSSALSKSYDQSVLAVREAMEEYPDRKIISIDTKSASMGQAVLIKAAAEASNAGKTLEETAAAAEEMIPNLQHWVMADDLNHLKRGGRVSGASAFVGTMLNVKPILAITPEGKLAPMAKARGRSKVIDYIIARMKENFAPKDNTVFIAHSDAPDYAEEMKAKIIENFGTKDFVINSIGPVIGAHTGPGTLAVLYLGNKGRPSA